jgi:NADPH:quinone reductase-like Zn-dependent oxidoreductase
VLILGTGGVAVFALQFVRLAGARAIVTSSSDAKLERALGLGASDGVNYRSVPEWQDEVLRLTSGHGVHHTVETSGAGTLPRSVAATRFGGWIHLIGVLTSGEIQPHAISRRAVTLRGIIIGSREMFEAMNRAIALHQLHPAIDRVFPFEDARGALHYLQGGSHVGKVVVAID